MPLRSLALQLVLFVEKEGAWSEKNEREDKRTREEKGLECQRVIFEPSLSPVIETIKKGSSQVCSVSIAFSLIPWPHTQLSPQLLLLASKGKLGQVHHMHAVMYLDVSRYGTIPVQCHDC